MLGPPTGNLYLPPKPTHGDTISPHAVRFCNTINKCKYLILFFWLCTWGAGAYCYKRFTEATDSSFESSPDSPSGEAASAFDVVYGSENKGKALMTLLQSVDGTSSLTDSSTNPDAYNTMRSFALALEKYASDTAAKEGCWANSTSYYSLVDAGLPLLASGYASNATATSAAGSSTFVYTLYTCHIDDNFLDDVKDYVGDSVPSTYATGGCTGIELFQKDTLAGVETDLSKMDRIVLPLALVILAVVLGNLPLMIVPILTIVTTICSEFTIMYPVALSMQVVSFTPSVMMSLTIAMSIDYSLFLLSRASEQIAKGNTVDNSIKEMVTTAGHTIIASGTTLCFCFVGMLFFPMEMLKSVGIGASVSILMALTVNLTLTPALLYTPLGEKMLAPNKYCARACCARPGTSRGVHSDMVEKILQGGEVLSSSSSSSIYGPDAGNNSSIIAKGIRLSSGKERASASNAGLSEALLSDVDVNGSNNVLLNPAGGSEGTFSIVDDQVRNQQLTALYDKLDEAAMYRSVWYKMGLQLLVPLRGVVVLLCVVALMTPIMVHFVNIQTSIAFDLMLPTDAPSLKTYNDVSASFGPGQLSPYKLLFDGTKTNTPVGSEAAFQTMQVVITTLQELSASASKFSFSGIVALGGPVSFQEYTAALQCVEKFGDNCPSEPSRAIAALAETLNNPAGTATYVSVTLAVDPFSNDGTDWLVDARDKLDKLTGIDGLDIYLVDGAGTTYDAVDDVYKVFPIMIAVTLSTVFVLMGCFFRSVVVPIRSVISICLTLAFVFGLSVLVYQDGAFSGLGLNCVSQTNQISWLPPVMTFSIIVGLGLDYVSPTQPSHTHHPHPEPQNLTRPTPPTLNPSDSLRFARPAGCLSDLSRAGVPP